MNNYNHSNDHHNYYPRNHQQNNRYQNNQYGGPPSGYNQNYNNNNTYGNYPPNQYNSYNQNHQPYSPRYDSYQQPQQQYPYGSNMYNQQPPPQYQYDQSYNHPYSNLPPGDLVQTPPPQQQVQNDQDYMNSKLIDFRGRLHEYIPFAAPRRAIVCLYTGKQSEDWLIQELIQNIRNFIEYKAGVTFLFNIQSKMTYKSQNLIDTIVNNYESILKIPDGYKLFSKIAENVTPEILINIAKWCFDIYPQYHTNEPDYINLLSVFVQVLNNKPEIFSKMINLDFYLKNPEASLIGYSIIDNCLDNVVSAFLNEINSNLSVLINNKDLVNLVLAFLIKADKNVRDSLFDLFLPQLESLLNNQWKWKIIKILLSTVSMNKKIQIAEFVCRNCASVRESYMDELVFYALFVVQSNLRVASLLSLVQPVLDNNEFPRVNDFVKNIKYADSVS